MWPALVRVADRLPRERLAAIHEEHTSTGAHRVFEQPFPEWVPEDVVQTAQRLSEHEAVSQLPTVVVTPLNCTEPNQL